MSIAMLVLPGGGCWSWHGRGIPAHPAKSESAWQEEAKDWTLRDGGRSSDCETVKTARKREGGRDGTRIRRGDKEERTKRMTMKERRERERARGVKLCIMVAAGFVCFRVPVVVSSCGREREEEGFSSSLGCFVKEGNQRIVIILEKKH